MAKYWSLSRKVYGAVFVVMFLVSILESAKCETTASATSVSTEVALPDVKNSQVQVTEIGSIKTVARRGSPGKTTGNSASRPSFLLLLVVMVIFHIAAVSRYW